MTDMKPISFFEVLRLHSLTAGLFRTILVLNAPGSMTGIVVGYAADARRVRYSHCSAGSKLGGAVGEVHAQIVALSTVEFANGPQAFFFWSTRRRTAAPKQMPD